MEQRFQFKAGQEAPEGVRHIVRRAGELSPGDYTIVVRRDPQGYVEYVRVRGPRVTIRWEATRGEVCGADPSADDARRLLHLTVTNLVGS